MCIRQSILSTLFVGFSGLLTAQGAGSKSPCPSAQPVPPELRIPATLAPGEPVAFERQLLGYFASLKYRGLGWCVDVGVRDSGPFIDQVNYGTHMAVRIYYSKEVSDWLLGGRQGAIADGAVIIKEQYMPPAQAWGDLYSGKPPRSPGDWVFMIRNSKASHDGWFWGEVWNNPTFSPMNFNDTYQYPNTGYGLYCIRCHASAEKESTFASLSNIEGYAGTDGPWPITYRIDESWRVPGWQQTYEKYLGVCKECFVALTAPLTAATPPLKRLEFAHNKNMQLSMVRVTHPGPAPVEVPSFLQTFPPEPWDKKVAGPEGHMPPYLTSDQCTGCHSGLPPGTAFGPAMMVYPPGTQDASKNVNVSEYGEWRWSPMGLAGRDPVFFAQIESEFSYAPDQKQKITDTCMNCHGAMGFKSYYLDHGIDPVSLGSPDPKPITVPGFNADWVFLRNPADPNFQYGGLARDGISCMVCHRMKSPADPSLDYFLSHTINGNFETEAAGKVNGPFKTGEITQYPMKTGLAVEPQGSEFIKTSRMCGACHTINLPILDKPGCKPAPLTRLDCTSVEQSTYLEWVNSDFQNEYGAGPKARSCQDCHMSTGYENTLSGLKVPVIQTRIATAQDTTYPFSDHSASPADLNVRFRSEGYHRHEFLGLNGILLQMFDQFVNDGGNNYILGVRLKDYMSGLGTDLSAAIANVVQQAGGATAKVTIPSLAVNNGKLTAQVKVENLTGHRLPSGVGFRRAFVEFVVYQDETPIFASGKTNSNGEIVDADGNVLPTEYFANGRWQPHYYGKDHARIDSPGKVQIYEELTQNAARQFTTSFLQRDTIVKDNRLLPAGYRHDGPPGVHIPEHFLEATRPVAIDDDPAYTSGSGTSTVEYEVPVPPGVEASRFMVKATLQYQSTPPYYFADRFKTTSPATTRLRYLKTNMELRGTDFQSWKLAIGSATRTAQ
jgi:hypothetical protein